VVNYDKGFAEMLQHPAFRNRRTPRHAMAMDAGLRSPRRSHANLRLRADARGCERSPSGGASYTILRICGHKADTNARRAAPALQDFDVLGDFSAARFSVTECKSDRIRCHLTADGGATAASV